MAEQRSRVDVGFTGGQILSLRLERADLDKVKKALGGAERFFHLDAGDSDVTLDLAQVVYLRVDTEDHRVGF